MNIIKRILRRLKKELKWKIGPKRYCIVCNKRFRGKFETLNQYYIDNFVKTGFPYGLDDGETLNYKEYTCPFCSCTDRERLYALYLNKNIQENRVYKLLDIAPSQPLKKNLEVNPKLQYRSADLSMEGVDDIIDIMDMNIYHDNSFDIFICSHVLEHVLDDRRAMKELYRILKPNGSGICMVPIVLAVQETDEDITVVDPNERWRRFGQDDHLRLYSKDDYLRRLTEAGFKVNQYTVNDFSKKEFMLMGISLKSVLYIVKK